MHIKTKTFVYTYITCTFYLPRKVGMHIKKHQNNQKDCAARHVCILQVNQYLLGRMHNKLYAYVVHHVVQGIRHKTIKYRYQYSKYTYKILNNF